MKNDKILEAKQLGERRAEIFIDLIPEAARDGYIADTTRQINKLDKKEAKIKNKLLKFRKLGPNPNMSGLGSMAVIAASELATVGAAALVSQGTDYQLAAMASGFILGAGAGIANVCCLYSRPATNAYRAFRRKMLNKKIDKIENLRAFTTSFLDKFQELREEEMGM